MIRFLSVLIVLLFSFTVNVIAQIESQWRGPNRDGIYPNEQLLKSWPSGGPDLLWAKDGFLEGYSSAAVTSDRIYVTGMEDDKGYLFALDLDGNRVWKIEYGPEWGGGYAGSRGTAAVVDDKIYLMSGEGTVYCIAESDGKILWSADLVKRFGARNLRWGMTESLLIDGDRLFCTPGGSDVMMAILDRNTGKTISTSAGNGEKSAYCSPSIIKHGNRRLVLTMTGESIVGLDADTFKYLFSASHRTRYDINPNTPLYHDGQIYSVSGYDTGGQLFNLSGDGSKIQRVWADETLDSQMGAAVLVDGFIYGSGHSNKGWHCIEWSTGNVQYSARELGNKGNIIYSDGLLYCYSEEGDIGLVRPNPGKFDIISSFKITRGDGAHWAHPVIRNGRLYVRHGDALMAYDISR